MIEPQPGHGVGFSGAMESMARGRLWPDCGHYLHGQRGSQERHGDSG
jgi:hypothetical protein